LPRIRWLSAVGYVIGGNSFFDKKKHADRLTVLRLLIRAGANLNAQDHEGNAALHVTYEADIARALIENGANVNLKNANGETPLMKNFDTEVTKLLIAAGADATLRDHEGKTAFDHARQLEPDGERTKFLAAVAAKQKKQ
jgi:ankyrin repeat protein